MVHEHPAWQRRTHRTENKYRQAVMGDTDARFMPTTELRVMDLDKSVTPTEVAEAIARGEAQPQPAIVRSGIV